jgi:hypothetical protein
LFITAKVDLPIGAAIVCVLGAALVLVATISKIIRKTSGEPGTESGATQAMSARTSD